MRTRAGFVVLLALAVGGCGGGRSVPDPGHHDAALVRHVDHKGFELSAPQGWRVGADAGGLITARSADGRRLVAIAPFLSPTDVDARGCLERAPSALGSAFPGARLGVTRAVGGLSQAVGDVRFTAHGAPARATLLCATSGRAGTLYAIAAPRAVFATARPQLLKILGTLRFRAVRSGLRFRTFRDPSEGAFTTQVPAGWRAEGELVRRGPTEAYPRVEAVAPGGRIRVFAGLKDPRTYATPNAAGVPEGTELPYAGATLVVQHYVPGAEFARNLAEHGLGCDGVTVLGGGDRPGAGAAIAQAFQSSGVQVGYDVGDVHFGCASARRRGYVVAATVLADTGSVGTWAVDKLFGYQAATAADERVARAALQRLAASWRIDPQWEARQQQTTAQVAAITRKADNEIAGLIDSTYADKQAVDDEVSRNWSNATLGETDVRDPGTGQEYKVESGSNFYWREVGADTVTGTQADTPPDVDFTPLEEL
jgi:hypothetical protein